MGRAFWIRRFLTVFVCAAAIIASAQRLKGHSVAEAVSQGVIWAALSASIFTGARIRQSRKGQPCALCRDSPRGEA